MSKAKTKANVDAACPCGLGARYSACCARYHGADASPAPTAEALMRSRYSAYVRGDEVYLLASWHPSTRPERLGLEDDVNPPQWLGLAIMRTDAGAQGDGAGTVEFIARYKVGGRAYRLHEISRFVYEDGRWWYVEGEVEA